MSVAYAGGNYGEGKEGRAGVWDRWWEGNSRLSWTVGEGHFGVGLVVQG